MIPINNDIRFEVSTKCNYNCCICPRDKLTRAKETMSLKLFRDLLDRILKETDQYDTVTFPGMGEPLLDDTLEGKIRYARKKGLNVLILSNGSLLDVEMFRRFDRLGVSSVRISLYGDDPLSYLKMHGIKNKRLFEKIKETLTEISELKRRTQLLLTFNILSGVNSENVESWIKYWKGRADLIEVWRPHNWVDGKSLRKVQPDKIDTCGRPFKGPLQIQVDGTVNMCCFDFDGKLTVGDLKSQSLKEIFDSPMYRKIMKHHSSGSFKGSGLICENCDQRNRDKDDVMVYNSKFAINERVNMISTTYKTMV